MQDLVRIGVPHAAEEPRVGERALERVVLRGEPCAERREVHIEDLQPAHAERREALLTFDQMQ